MTSLPVYIAEWMRMASGGKVMLGCERLWACSAVMAILRMEARSSKETNEASRSWLPAD